jgi:hypothetical protein
MSKKKSSPTDRHPRGPEETRRVARELGYRGADSLYVLARNNDPFAKGTPAHVRDAEWFAEIWADFEFTTGVHLRRVHYRLLSAERKLPSGEPYENTEGCWGKLCQAGAAARILGSVDAEAFVDRRNPQVTLNRSRGNGQRSDPRVGFHVSQWRLPEFDPDWLTDIALELPSPYATGFDYDPDDQPVLVEVWIEKSTMDDVLAPLCRQAHVNYAQAKGFESITHMIELVRRAEHHRKPAHVIYVSDFDPAGDKMPVAVARQVQYWREALDVTEHVTLEPVVLTFDQVVKYQLPRLPIPDGERRAAGFEDRFGEGAVELDALEALHPGELANIIRQAIRPHVDQGLSQRLREAEDDADQAITEAWEPAADGLQAEADRLVAEARETMAEQAEAISALVGEQLNQLGPFQERAEELVRQAEELAEGLDIELPARPEPEIAGMDGRCLFDTRRHWHDQLALFKERQERRPGS